MGVFVPSKKDGKVHLKKIPNFIKNKWKIYDEYEYYNMNDKRTNELKEVVNEDIKKSGKTPQLS